VSERPNDGSFHEKQKNLQVASGAVHCQILDACHPGVVNMSKVNFDAKNEYDMVNNYKQLQIVFDKLKISRNIEVGKLVKARPLDNLEFLQWMKHYYDTATGGVRPADYDGDVRRQQSKGAARVRGVSQGANAKRSANAGAATTTRAAKGPDADRAPMAPRDVRRGGIAAAPAELKALGAANAELKLAVERTEQEREFYFEKLQDIEFLCQRPEFADTALARVVEKILYFTEGKPDVDAIIRECRDAPEGEAAAPVPAAPLTVATVATETIVPAEEEAVATPTFDEAAALGAALENECVDLTAPSSPLASSLCVSKDASTRAPLSPLSPQPTNAS
jgi:RP/EB family microtubule-associated protein